MDFSTEDIESMLKEYEADTHTGMDIPKIAQLIYNYTSGYPVLVSSICKKLDEEIAGTKPFPTLSDAWTETGVLEAVRIIVKDQDDNQASSMIFDSLTTHIERYPELGGMLRKILFDGDKITFIKTNKAMTLGLMFGYMSKKGEFLQVTNRMFEMWLYDLFLAEDSLNTSFPKIDTDGEPPFIKDNKLNMDLVMEKFVEYFTAPREQVADDEAFLEKQGRRMFLLFLKPIINGVGSYYIEAKTPPHAELTYW